MIGLLTANLARLRRFGNHSERQPGKLGSDCVKASCRNSELYLQATSNLVRHPLVDRKTYFSVVAAFAPGEVKNCVVDSSSL